MTQIAPLPCCAHGLLHMYVYVYMLSGNPANKQVFVADALFKANDWDCVRTADPCLHDVWRSRIYPSHARSCCFVWVWCVAPLPCQGMCAACAEAAQRQHTALTEAGAFKCLYCEERSCLYMNLAEQCCCGSTEFNPLRVEWLKPFDGNLSRANVVQTLAHSV